jgi:hypothetical protein
MRITIATTTAIALAVFLLQAFVVSAAPTKAEAIVVKGDVTAMAVGAVEPQLVQRGSTVGAGSTIRTAIKSDVLMSAFPGSAVRVMEDNEVILKEADLRKRGETVIGRKVVLNLRRGKVMVAIDKPEKGNIDFTINTPQCVAAARGTVFSTSAEPGFTKTVVLDGVVDMIGEGSGGKEAVPVPLGTKVTAEWGKGKDGVLLYGPVPATEEELKELMDFLKEAAEKGLVKMPAIGAPPAPLPLQLQYFNAPPNIPEVLDQPVSP